MYHVSFTFGISFDSLTALRAWGNRTLFYEKENWAPKKEYYSSEQSLSPNPSFLTLGRIACRSLLVHVALSCKLTRHVMSRHSTPRGDKHCPLLIPVPLCRNSLCTALCHVPYVIFPLCFLLLSLFTYVLCVPSCLWESMNPYTKRSWVKKGYPPTIFSIVIFYFYASDEVRRSRHPWNTVWAFQ